MTDVVTPSIPINFTLNGKWMLTRRPIEKASYGSRPTDNAIVANVPGDVHLDLMQHGDIGDPLVRDNAKKCAWIGEHEWWYSKTFNNDFTANAKHELIFDGLCYVADIWLNGEHIGHHLNMHRPLRINVTGKLNIDDDNLLVVRLLAFDDNALNVPVIKFDMQFKSGQNWSEAMGEGIANKEHCLKRGASHKAFYSLGWDWTQGLSICGIWRGVRIESTPIAGIEDIFVVSGIDGDIKVTFSCKSNLREVMDAKIVLILREKSSGRDVCRKDENIIIGPGHFEYALEAFIEEPQLWWPAGLGAQFIYEAELSLSINSELAATEKTQFGIRSFEIHEPIVSEDQGAFRFVINGVYVFAKGTNWVPPDIIPARVDYQRYELLLDQYVEAGFNYLRFWGGGIYERERFYELCDEKGIMLLHDMMFSCLEVPDFDTAFVEEAVREVEYNVKRLRNHASILIWSGANESDLLPEWGVRPRPNGEYYGYHLYHVVFPEIIAKLDPTRPYMPTDPCLGKHNPDGKVSNFKHGTYHGNFGTTAFTQDDEIDIQGVPSFVNECYAASPSSLGSMLRYLDETQLAWNNPVFKKHEIVSVCMPGDEKQLFSRHLYSHSSLRFEDLPFQEKADAFTINHCLLVKRFLEVLRLRRDHCGGVAFWMFNSAFTMNDWSFSDYYCLPKPVFYEVKRSNRMVLPVIAIYHERVEFHVINDLLTAVNGELRCEIRKFSGESVWSENLYIVSEANSVGKHVVAERKNLVKFDPFSCFVQVTFAPDGEKEIVNHRFFNSPRELKLLNSAVKITPVLDRRGSFVLSSPYFVSNIQLAPHAAELRADDNFFDLLPGIEKIVTFNHPVKLEEVRLDWNNRPERKFMVLNIAKPQHSDDIPPIEWRVELFNPSTEGHVVKIVVNAPEGVTTSYPQAVRIESGAIANVFIVFCIDPFIAKAGDFPIDIALDDYTVFENIYIKQTFRIVRGEKLEIVNTSGMEFRSEPWFIRYQSSDDMSAPHVPIGVLQSNGNGICQCQLELPSNTLPYSCEIWNSHEKIGEFCGGAMTAGELFRVLPVQPFIAGNLRFYPTGNAYWPDLLHEGHGFMINGVLTDKSITWKKCDLTVEAMLFLHYDREHIYFNVFVRNMPFRQPFTGLQVWQASCLEIVLGRTDGPDFVDFSLALTTVGPQQFYRRGIISGQAKDPRLKIYHQSEENLTSYHYAFPVNKIPGIIDHGSIKLAMVICGENADMRITLFNGVVMGLGTAKAGVVPLEPETR